MKKIILTLILLIGTMTQSFADSIDIVVTGSKTGSVNLQGQQLTKDATDGKILNIKEVNLVSPGSACAGFVIVKEKLAKGESFIAYSDNLYQAQSALKNDPSCPLVSFDNAKPIVTLVQGMYLITTADMTLEKYENESLKVGFAYDNDLYRSWFKDMSDASGTKHTFVGYNGSGDVRKGMLSGEIDAYWQTYSDVLALNKSQPDKFKVIATAYNDMDVDVPVITKRWKNEKLARGFVGTWYFFNDKKNLTKSISNSLKKNNAKGNGEWGAWTKNNKKKVLFDVRGQASLINGVRW